MTKINFSCYMTKNNWHNLDSFTTNQTRLGFERTNTFVYSGFLELGTTLGTTTVERFRSTEENYTRKSRRWQTCFRSVYLCHKRTYSYPVICYRIFMHWPITWQRIAILTTLTNLLMSWNCLSQIEEINTSDMYMCTINQARGDT